MSATITKSVSRSNAKPESIVNDAPRVFTEADWPVGSVAHQGDLILVRIASMPKGMARKNRQMAEGNTQGSRHVVSVGTPFDCDAPEVARLIKSACPKASVGESYIGPVFGTVSGRAELTHPEHGDHIYQGDMIVACVYQRNLDAEEREQRVRD